MDYIVGGFFIGAGIMILINHFSVWKPIVGRNEAVKLLEKKFHED